MAWTWVSHEDSEEYGMMEGAPAYALMDSVEQRAGHQAGPRFWTGGPRRHAGAHRADRRKQASEAGMQA